MKNYLLILLLLFASELNANKRASEIYLDLQKLHSLNRVLYIAAHPDDENTRLLAYLSLGEKAETAYLSLTRGDGGQNLIGNELSEKLGVLRTQELLAARSYDRARQYFSRAVDFGYSKSATESLDKWGHEEILSDVVLVIRKFRPDIIITRFPPDKRGGHGHHTASAMLAIEAFEKAADPAYEPDQVGEYGTWQTTSLYWNTSYWWMKDIADSAAKYPERYFSQDIGGYSPLLGMSYNEIGTIARSQHKCQGFGAVIERGSRIEYFEHLKGETIEYSFFEHSKHSWSNIIDEEFESELNQLLQSFDFTAPEKNLSALLSIQKQLDAMPESTFRDEKMELCNDIIVNCLGLYIEVLSDDYATVFGDTLNFQLSALSRTNIPIEIKRLIVNGQEIKGFSNQSAEKNLQEIELTYLNNAKYSNPYWLEKPFVNTFYVENKDDLGRAEDIPTFLVEIIINIEQQELRIFRMVEHKWRDPSFGERRRPVISVPSITANFESDLQLMKIGEKKTVRLSIRAFSDNIKETLSIQAPDGWEVSPTAIPVELSQKHDQKWFEFELSASEKAVNGPLTLELSNGESPLAYHEIVYDHIPTQTIQQKASMGCVALDVEINKGKVAYIKGVDDAVPQAISQLGFDVELFEVSDLSTVDLSVYQSVVLGIRIYNVFPELTNHHAKLFEYVENGGNLIMQYNTASRTIRDESFGPTPFKLSRDRVTEEDAEVKLLVPNHQIFNTPNKITDKDFENWVQERGLYFAGEWSEEYTPLISWHDEGEEAVEGGLIVCNYGKGQFIYTGISFFRELPKGVVGAYRLFANMLSYESK